MSDAAQAALIGAAVVAVSSIGAAWAAVFIFRRTSAVLQLRLQPRWPTGNSDLVILGFDIENVSDIRIDKEVARIRVAEYDPSSGLDGPDAQCLGSEWVDLKTDWKSLGVPDPPIPDARTMGTTEILTSTLFLNPRELLHVERVYRLGPSGMLHVALQVRKRLPLSARMIDILPRKLRWSRGSKQRTATWYVARAAGS